MQTSETDSSDCISCHNFSSTFDAFDMPENVWILIMVFCDLRDLLSLEQTCTLLHRLASSRPIWIKHLHSLDQAHAPAVHPRTALATLTGPQLRQLVVRAVRRYNNCVRMRMRDDGSSPPDSLAQPRVTRECVVPLAAQGSSILGTLSEWGSELMLLPGGRHLLIKWPRGYVQCWDVSTGACLQTYPPLPQNSADEQQMRVLCVDYDVCLNGDVFVLVLSEFLDREDNSRILEIFTFSSSENSLTLLHRQMPTELGKHLGKPIFVKIHGDIVVVYFEGRLVVKNWAEGRLLSIDNIILDDLQILDNYLFSIQDRTGDKFLIVVPLSHITDILKEDSHLDSDRKDLHLHIHLTDLPVVESPIAPPEHWLISRAKLSACALNWRDASERDLVSITVLADVYSESEVRDFPVTYAFLLCPDLAGPGDRASGRHVVDNSASLSLPASTATRTGYARSGPAAAQPLARLLFRGHTELARTAAHAPFEREFRTYSILSAPSRCATAVIAFHSDELGLNNQNRDALRPAPVRTLATFVQGQVLFCSIDHLTHARPPATRSLYIEFYSGAVYYATADSASVVILHFD